MKKLTAHEIERRRKATERKLAVEQERNQEREAIRLEIAKAIEQDTLESCDYASTLADELRVVR